MPAAAVTEHIPYHDLKALENRRWGGLFELLPGFDFHAAEDLRLHQSELVANGASEFSIGEGIEPPWLVRRAAAQRRFPTPDEPGGRYHGKAPRIGEFWRYRRPRAQARNHGSRQLHNFLKQNG